MARDDRQLASAQRADRILDGAFEADSRSPAQRDRDRVLYSAEFRRLAGVTQVSAAGDVELLHNRLTHSLKVAQIGRRLSERLRHKQPDLFQTLALDVDVVESAGLAHDIGHPPFGHVGEAMLDELLREHRLRFNGNAQSFRIVTKLSRRKAPPSNGPYLVGLDLTRATLNAVLKYPAVADQALELPNLEDRSLPTSWGVYDTEARHLAFARADTGGGTRRSPEAILMDWSDDVSYATHDIEDYVRNGVIPFHAIDRDLDEIVAGCVKRMNSRSATFDQGALESAFENLFPPTASRYQGSLAQEYDLRQWVSLRITRLEQAVELISESPFVTIDAGAIYLAEALKAITRFYVIDTPALAASQEGQRSVVRQLFEALWSWSERDGHALPVALREQASLSLAEEADAHSLEPGQVMARSIADYLCSLTEAQTVDLYERVSGVSPSSTIAPWL
jgi:dGTPase